MYHYLGFDLVTSTVFRDSKGAFFLAHGCTILPCSTAIQRYNVIVATVTLLSVAAWFLYTFSISLNLTSGERGLPLLVECCAALAGDVVVSRPHVSGGGVRHDVCDVLLLLRYRQPVPAKVRVLHSIISSLEYSKVQ